MNTKTKNNWLVRLQNILNSSAYEFTKDVLGKIPGRPIKAEYLYTSQLNKLLPPSSSHKTDEQINIRECTTDDVNLLCECVNKRNLFERRFSNGEVCIIATYNNSIIGYEWFSLQAKYHDERNVFTYKIHPDSIYAYDAYIQPEHRGKDVFYKITHAANKLVQKHNRKRLVAHIEHENYASLISHKRLGFNIVDSTIFISIFNRIVTIRKKPPTNWPIKASSSKNHRSRSLQFNN